MHGAAPTHCGVQIIIVTMKFLLHFVDEWASSAINLFTDFKLHPCRPMLSHNRSAINLWERVPSRPWFSLHFPVFSDVYFKRSIDPRQHQWQISLRFKGIYTDSNNILLWYESGDINEKSLFSKFQLIPILRFQVMHDYVCFIAPIDCCVE